MKELSLYKIRDLAMDSGRAVFSAQELSNLIGKPKAIATVYAARLAKNGLAFRVLKGKISFTKDDFVVATQLVEPSYISLGSALRFHGLISQVQKNIECVSTKNSYNFKTLGIIYHKIPSALFFGYKKHKKGNSYVLVAEPEKALVDGIYLNHFSKKDLQEFSGMVDFSKMKGLLKKFNGKGSKKIAELIE